MWPKLPTAPSGSRTISSDGWCDLMRTSRNSKSVVHLDQHFPGGDVVVTFDDTVLPNEYTIRINWVEPGENLFYEIIIPVNGF